MYVLICIYDSDDTKEEILHKKNDYKYVAECKNGCWCEMGKKLWQYVKVNSHDGKQALWLWCLVKGLAILKTFRLNVLSI